MSKFLIIENGVEYATRTSAKKGAKELSVSHKETLIHLSDMESGEIKIIFYNGKQVSVGYVVAAYNADTRVTAYLAKDNSSETDVFDTEAEAEARASEFLLHIPSDIFRLSVEQKIFEIQ